MSASVYGTFHYFFIPLILDISQSPFSVGQLPSGWVSLMVSVMLQDWQRFPNCGPLRCRMSRKSGLCILCLFKLSKFFQQLTHKQQVGCGKGRQMIHHIQGVKGGFDLLNKSVLVSFDFSNTFPALSHRFWRSCPQNYSNPTFPCPVHPFHTHSPYHYCVGKGVVTRGHVPSMY